MKKELLELMEKIESSLTELKSKLQNIVEQEQPQQVEEKIVVETKIQEITHVDEPTVNDALRQFIANPAWIPAVPPDLICDENSYEDKMDRARGIRDIFNPSFNYEGKKVLDLGTGYGHLVQAISEKNPAIVVGYDVKNEFQVGNSEKSILTTSWDEVVKNGPYDFIMIYDVLDHAIDETPQNILIKAKSVLTSNGIIRMRCHPFISKHGGHAYTKINKAYAHLILTEAEMKEIGHDFKNFPTIRVTTPLKTYSSFISGAGLKTVDHKVVNEPADGFFLTGNVSDRIKMNLHIRQLLIPQMGMQFVDYTLSN